jgi:hypothetical protein
MEIDITDNGYQWVERIGKAAYDLASDRIKSEEHNNNFIIKSSEPVLLGYIVLAIKQHLDALPPNMRPIFQHMLYDVEARKDNLERS